MAKRQRRAQRQAAPDPRTDADDTIEHESAESPAQEAQEDPEDNSRDRELCGDKEVRDALPSFTPTSTKGFRIRPTAPTT
jgi:hypothetical protein